MCVLTLETFEHRFYACNAPTYWSCLDNSLPLVCRRNRHNAWQHGNALSIAMGKMIRTYAFDLCSYPMLQKLGKGSSLRQCRHVLSEHPLAQTAQQTKVPSIVKGFHFHEGPPRIQQPTKDFQRKIIDHDMLRR